MNHRSYMNHAHMLLWKNIVDFEAEHGVQPKYAAISDTDSIYMTPVAPEDMFDERGRPVIIARFLSNKAESNSKIWHKFSMGTKIPPQETRGDEVYDKLSNDIQGKAHGRDDRVH